MTLFTLVRRSLSFHARSHLGVVLGAMVGSAALIGALVVGDSVRGSLREAAAYRLGKTAFALSAGDRFFEEDLAGRVAPPGDPERPGEERPVAALLLPGLIARQDGAARANRVNLIGTLGARSNAPGSLSALAPDPAPLEIKPGEVWLNGALAVQLGAKPGDPLVARVHKPSALSQDAPITPRADQSVALRLRVAGLLAPARLGDFSLRAGATPPLNAFVNAAELQNAAGLSHRANLLLVPDQPAAERSSGPAAGRVVPPGSEDPAGWQARLAQHWSLADAELRWQFLAGAESGGAPRAGASPSPRGLELELSTRRIFLEPAVVAAALAERPPTPPARATASESTSAPGGDPVIGSAVAKARPILTYLVNQICAGERTTPYSMVTAAGPPWTPAGLRDDEIVLNAWLADDLQAKPGDQVSLSYFLADSGLQLIERTNRFRVHSVVPLNPPFADRTLMPEFPGLAKAESTHDWDAGFPLVHKIRDQDEAYWRQWRGTPKAFVSLAAGQRMWSNRFGALTAIRFPVPPSLAAGAARSELGEAGNGSGTNRALDSPALAACRQALERHLLSALRPERVGLRFEAVRAQAQAGAEQAQDFGGLFLGFSFFLIVAALILMALLFQFGLEQRRAEVGTLLALGFEPRRVRRLFLWEGIALGFLGGLIGVAGGVLYARAVLAGLGTVWRDAVGGSRLSFHASAQSLLLGLAAGVIVAALTLWLTLRKLGRQPAHALLTGTQPAEGGPAHAGGLRSKRVTFGSALVALGLVAWAVVAGETSNPGVFFGAGALCLVAALAGVSWLLADLARSEGRGPTVLTLAGLAVRGVTRRRTRSLATAALLACGSFMIVAVGANRLDANLHADRRSSGTGGFTLMAETTLPVVKDLNTKEGRDFFGLGKKAMVGVSFVPFRVKEGDEASCLNLNRAQQPRLFGVRPEALQSRGAFRFAQTLRPVRPGQEWLLLRRQSTNDPIPAIGDAASIQWALGKRLGDRIEVTDEAGRPHQLQLVGALANSVLQGRLLIAEEELLKLAPSQSGYRAFLIDAAPNRLGVVSADLSRQLQDVGLELVPTALRLAQFNAVQNTYLNTFQVLGGLGLLLGSAGLGVVVLRNVLERRSELAVLLAVGFDQGLVRRLVLAEHAALLLLGLAAGLVAALVSVAPAFFAPSTDWPLGSLGLTLGGVLAAGLLWTYAATCFALRGRLLEALRNE